MYLNTAQLWMLGAKQIDPRLQFWRDKKVYLNRVNPATY